MNLKEYCAPRDSVFNRSRRYVVLDLSDLLEKKINAGRFFEENFITSGMKTLLEKTFGRLEGSSDQASTFLLTQSMGGGKTHNMIVLGLLAENPELRKIILGEKTAFEAVIDRAVEIASDHLVPVGIARQQWKTLSAPERLYLKGLELEKHKEARSGAYQELAKGFGVRDYTLLYASTKANEVRFKTGSEFKRSHLGGSGFAGSLTRNILFAVHETVRTEDAREGLKWFHAEVDTYWDRRRQIIDILNYLSTTAHIPHMPHWEKDADAARRLAGAVENDHGGRA